MNTNAEILQKISYCNSLTSYSRRLTREVYIGEIPLGGKNPIRVQSMTTVDTMDTRGSVEQIIRMVNSGSEYVRLTAPSLKEAENLKHIRKELRNRGCYVPLVADIHFTPNAAEMAAKIVEKVRINPGNYADKKKFETLTYTDASYQAELERIRDRFLPLVKICKEYGTAMRIGTNHGSLSDRIMSRYGDTPLGMVESALEFLRICEDENFFDIVISMKASNTQVMVQAYRLLVAKLDEEGFQPYPLHLGVTEAGDGEDGRIKSAVGIGTLLEDGLGDTVRVSLTEAPEVESPVAKIMVDRYLNRNGHQFINPIQQSPKDPFKYSRRNTAEVLNIGGQNVPRVITDVSKIADMTYADLKVTGHHYLPEPDKWTMTDQGCDYLYAGDHPIPFMLPNGVKEIVNYGTWRSMKDRNDRFPLISRSVVNEVDEWHPRLNFVKVDAADLEFIQELKSRSPQHLVIILTTQNAHGMAEQRRFFFELMHADIDLPVVISRTYDHLSDHETITLHSATDLGGLFVDGFGDGVFVPQLTVSSHSREDKLAQVKFLNGLSFGILQATRTRMTKTEYISCPSCGRTLFDLQETTAMIRKRTDHLKGVKIGIMGCIVNGPGEMADADYGYVGSGKGKITLYRGQNVVKRNVPSEQAVDELIEIIREDGAWIEPSANEVVSR
jgi:(E)-4-hydroxy-3-methylbut-2-enyl-diphosphate synthase